MNGLGHCGDAVMHAIDTYLGFYLLVLKSFAGSWACVFMSSLRRGDCSGDWTLMMTEKIEQVIIEAQV